MNEQIRKNTVISCLIIFGILILVHGFEAIVQLLSFTVVLVVWMRKKKKGN